MSLDLQTVQALGKYKVAFVVQRMNEDCGNGKKKVLCANCFSIKIVP